jgi:hypothetical protein
MCLEVLAATEFKETFSGRKQRQDAKVFRPFGTSNSAPFFRVCWWFGSTKTTCFSVAKPPAHALVADGIISRNVGKPSHPDAAFCPTKCHCRKLLKKPMFLETGLFPLPVLVLSRTCHRKWTLVEGTRGLLEVIVMT